MSNLFENKKKLLVIVAVVFVILIIVALIVSSLFKKSGPITLTYWGLWEEPGVYAEVIAAYQKDHPNVTVKYSKISKLNYRDRLATAINGNDGPDIIRIHNSWLPMMVGSLSPAPQAVFSPTVLKNTFYPVVFKDLVLSGKVYGVPLGIDTLVMYVNNTLLRAGQATIPTTWDGPDGFLNIAKKLTVRDPNGRLKTSGAALGTAGNVDHWQEIIGLMMLQSGVDLTNASNTKAAADTLSFYTSFAKGQPDWDEIQDNSTVAFARGMVAFYFGPSWRYFEIKEINPTLDFKVVPVPQLTGASAVNYATYWTEAVSKKSKNTAAAWDFLKYLTGKDQLTKIYTAEAKLRAFGEPYPRTDMSALLAADQNVNPVVTAAPTAKSWFLQSRTYDGDSGINSKIGKYFLDAVNGSLKGSDVARSLETVQQGVTQVLGGYR